jgi:hypothetical protein
MLVVDIGFGTLHEPHGCYLARGEYVGKESGPSVFRPGLGDYKRHMVPTSKMAAITPTSAPMSCLSSSLANRRRVLLGSMSVTR